MIWRRDRLWLVFLAIGAVATVLYAADIAPEIAFAVVGVGCVVSWSVGPRMHAVRSRRPWRLLTVAGICFLLGVILRPMLTHLPPPQAQVGDVFTLCGFIFMIAGLVSFLNRWGMDRHALVDGLIVCIGAAVASMLLFALPAASIPNRPLVVTALAGIYPLLDTIVVLLVANLAFTTAIRQPSFLLLGGMMVLLFTGDLGFAVVGRTGNVAGSPVFEVPYVLAFALGGAAALHPTARALGRATPLPIQAWSVPRLLVIGPAVITPFVLTVTLAHQPPIARWILGVGGVAIVALLLVRAASAVQSHAATQRRFEHQATHDPLTGLPNRRMLASAVDQLLSSDRHSPGDVWMFYLDLDGFKLVNDSWGHPAGDRLIIDVGARLRDALPSSATVARIGGDEFVIVERCTEPEAMAHARRIMDCVDHPLQVATADGVIAEVVVGASMGIVHGDGPVDPDILMRDADTAMYQAKAAGRNRWTVFDPAMRDAVRERIEIEVALRAAVAHEQLTIAYQPIVDIHTGWPAGAEALVRWDHPVRGWIGPNVFIPVAEDSNLISALGAWVLRQSVLQLARWRADGVVDDDFWLSVNVSPRQLNDVAFAGRVEETLLRTGVPTANIVLEITESVMVEGTEVAERVLVDLRKLGLRIAVDDFGTGFSALGYLRRHPVTGVKIDRSFVNGLGGNAEDEEIVRAVVAMSTALRLSVVAEGVETPIQRDVLIALGVPLAQGWLWGKAIEAGLFAATWAIGQRVGGSLAVRSDLRS